MKKIFSLILLYPLALFAQPVTCKISIKITDLTSPAVLYMRMGNHTDTLHTTNGQMTWNKDIDHPQQGVLTIDYTGNKRSDYQPLFLANGHISITISNPDGPYQATVDGLSEAVSYENDLWKPVHLQNEAINELKRDYTDAVNKRSSDTLTRHTLIFEAVKKCFDIPRQFIKTHPTSLLSIEALKYMGNGDPTNADRLNELKALYASLSQKVKESPEGIIYQNKLNLK
ncbi:MAG: hypothetical protein JWQ34_2631 [Mucilaginibacter sp.]|uniref:DUF4369 domain-containing protein n=1 Tax=Mucilaginibacter sp. TaxID=1882438 RepID=UPI0026058A87|nr:DUF4369 domain-containing protein [Mucilaginibacter sp.]MDB5004406.1 hypothetical protein [Mucilaginibacter sp.]